MTGSGLLPDMMEIPRVHRQTKKVIAILLVFFFSPGDEWIVVYIFYHWFTSSALSQLAQVAIKKYCGCMQNFRILPHFLPLSYILLSSLYRENQKQGQETENL